MTAIVDIISRHGLRIEACHNNKPKKSRISLHRLSNSSLKQLYISNKIERFSYKHGCAMILIEAFKRRAGLSCRLIVSGY